MMRGRKKNMVRLQRNFRAILWGAVFSLMVAIVMPGEGRAAQVTAQQIYEAAREYILNETGFLSDQIVLQFRSPFPAIEVPDTEEVEVVVSGEVDQRTLGRLPLHTRIFVDGQLYKTFYPIFEFDRYTDAIITTRWIKRGQEFTPSNVSLVSLKASDLPRRAVSHLRILENKVAKVSLPKGKVIAGNHIEVPPLIERKQIVTVVVKSQMLTAQTRGMALSDGKRGELIKVKNMDSGNIVYGKIYDENTVIVEVP